MLPYKWCTSASSACIINARVCVHKEPVRFACACKDRNLTLDVEDCEGVYDVCNVLSIEVSCVIGQRHARHPREQRRVPYANRCERVHDVGNVLSVERRPAHALHARKGCDYLCAHLRPGDEARTLRIGCFLWCPTSPCKHLVRALITHSLYSFYAHVKNIHACKSTFHAFVFCARARAGWAPERPRKDAKRAPRP